MKLDICDSVAKLRLIKKTMVVEIHLKGNTTFVISSFVKKKKRNRMEKV